MTWNGRKRGGRDRGHNRRDDGNGHGNGTGSGNSHANGNGSDKPAISVASASAPGPAPIHLPDLSAGTWKFAPESPESQPGFDDSGWQLADKTTTDSTTKPPAGQPVLTEDDYGFHQGDVWYRGSYSGASAATTVTMRYRRWRRRPPTGLARRRLPRPGCHRQRQLRAPDDRDRQLPDPGEPADRCQHVLAVMVRNDGRNEDGGVNDAQKEGRGLISVGMTDASQAAVTPRSPGGSRATSAARTSSTRTAASRTTAACSASVTAGTCPAIPTGAGSA